MEDSGPFGQRGAALLMVLLVAMMLAAVAVGTMFTLDRGTVHRAAYQRSVAGFYAAEGALNYAAAEVMDALLNRGGRVECGVRSLPIAGRIIFYRLAGCGQAPVTRAELDPPFEGLNGTVYTYTVDATAVNGLGMTDAHLTMQFQVHVIPVLQFAAVSPTDINMRSLSGFLFQGPVYSSGDVYLGDWCPDNQGIPGRVIAGGAILPGISDPGGASATGSAPPSGDGSAPSGCVALGGGSAQITTGIRTLFMPDAKSLTCTPWSCPGRSAGGSYWARASIRIVLDTTAAMPLAWGEGPVLFPIVVMRPDGLVDSTKTAALRLFMMTNPGAFTYSDVPLEDRDCRVMANCEDAYANPVNYAPFFPSASPKRCFVGRNPRDKITARNYCYDYRYGGFYNWREGRPILMLNVDWGALEKWNSQHNGVLFNPGDSPGAGSSGLIAFFSVKGAAASGTNNYGVRIFDAARLQGEMGGRGVTLVSDVAAYVVGDYNCPAMATTFAGRAQPCQDSVSSTVVADTINVLSCAWIDEGDRACSGGAVDPRPASAGRYRLLDERSTVPATQTVPARDTHANAALVGGNAVGGPAGDPVTRSGMSTRSGGGLETFIGLHENWSARKLVIAGGLIDLGAAQHTCSASLSPPGQVLAKDPVVPCEARSPGHGPLSEERFGRPYLEVSAPARSAFGPGTPPFGPLAGFITRDWLVELPRR